mgnify:CR=1 FL=1
MEYIWAGLLIFLLAGSQVLQIFGGPANWVAIILIAIWKWLYPASMEWTFIAAMAAIALTGEIMEFLLQTWGAKKYGAGKLGNLGGIVGAIAGAIIGAPFLFGLGALPGALAGAYLGCLAVELKGKSFAQARHAALGAFWGKAFGLTLKTTLGAIIVVMSIPKIWP